MTTDDAPIAGRCAILWSGGKDSCLALWRAKASGYNVDTLVNFIDEASSRVRFHAVRREVIVEQARALDVRLLQVGTTPEDFEQHFAKTLGFLREEGVSGLIAGDIHLEDVRRANQARAAAAGLTLVEPLWHQPGVPLLRELVAAKFRAVLTCCDQRWASVLAVGQEITPTFIDKIEQTDGIDPCGERGEYHSLVFDGPLFSEPIRWAPGETRRSLGFDQLDVVLTPTPHSRHDSP